MSCPEQPSYEELTARNAELLAMVAEQSALIESLRAEVWTPTGFVDTIRSGTMVYEERTGSGTGSQEVHPGI